MIAINRSIIWSACALLFAPLTLHSASVTAADAFAQLKTLNGAWRGTADKAASASDVTVLYRTTANGSAVVETILPGTDHEMVTVYYVDGKRLVMTHYCAMGNQPRMALQSTSSPDLLRFEFIGGANIKPRADTYMHGESIRFLDKDQITTEWTLFKAGKAAGVTKFTLKRSPA